MTAHEWLVDNLKRHVAEEREKATQCRDAYTKGPMREACLILATAHEEAADAFKRRLDAIGKPA